MSKSHLYRATLTANDIPEAQILLAADHHGEATEIADKLLELPRWRGYTVWDVEHIARVSELVDNDRIAILA